MKHKKITFASSDSTSPTPLQFEPAKFHIPEWYQAIKPYKDDKPSIDDGIIVNSTVKRCIPVYDALTSGYMALLHCDLLIETEELDNGTYNINYKFAYEPNPISIREYNTVQSLPLHDSYIPIELVWHIRWQINTESNSSILVTHPLNRLELPFTTTSGIVDTDNNFLAIIGQVPFYIKKGFSGVIPAGTPMFQVIPFERQHYKSEVLELSEHDKYKRLLKWQKYFVNGYRKVHWVKKNYE